MGTKSSKEKEEEKVTPMWNRGAELDMTKQGAATLVTEIKEIQRPFKEQGTDINILVFGPTGCGKSSLLNGFRTALMEQKIVPKYFQVGTRQEKSYTKTFQWMKWEGITLFDMAGVFESEDIKSENVLDIIKGNAPFTGKYDDFLNPEKDAQTGKEINVSSVVLVLKPGMELSVNLKRIFGQIHNAAGKGELAYHVVLTHLDKVEDRFNDPKNLGDIFVSQRVQSAVMQMSGEIGIPPNTISFVRNYAYEAEANTMSNVLLLHTFSHIVSAARDQELKRDTHAAHQ